MDVSPKMLYFHTYETIQIRIEDSNGWAVVH